MVPGTMLQRMQTSLKNQKPKKYLKKCQTFFLLFLSKCQSTSRIFFSSALGFETNCSMSENTHRSLKFRLMNLSGVRDLHSKQLVDTKGFFLLQKVTHNICETFLSAVNISQVTPLMPWKCHMLDQSTMQVGSHTCQWQALFRLLVFGFEKETMFKAPTGC